MGVKTVRVCDATGDELVAPFHMGFVLDGKPITLEVNKDVAQKFVLTMARRLNPGDLEEIMVEFFGNDWDKHA